MDGTQKAEQYWAMFAEQETKIITFLPVHSYHYVASAQMMVAHVVHQAGYLIPVHSHMAYEEWGNFQTLCIEENIFKTIKDNEKDDTFKFQIY